MKSNGDSVSTARLRRRCAAELEKLDPAAVPEDLRGLVARYRSPEYRDGVLDGYAFAKLPELLVMASRPGRARGRRLELHFGDRHITDEGESFYRAWRVVIGGETPRLSPVDFAFYACLVRRRLSGRDLVRWNTTGLRKEFEDEYRRVTNPMDSIRERVMNGLARRGGVTREWFDERRSRVNKAIGRLGEGVEELYGIVKRGSRPNTSYGLIVDPRCIRIRDGPSVAAVTGGPLRGGRPIPAEFARRLQEPKRRARRRGRCVRNEFACDEPPRRSFRAISSLSGRPSAASPVRLGTQPPRCGPNDSQGFEAAAPSFRCFISSTR